VGSQEELADFIYALKQEGADVGDWSVHPEGVVFQSVFEAKPYSERHGKILVRIDGKVSGWLAKNPDPEQRERFIVQYTDKPGGVWRHGPYCNTADAARAFMEHAVKNEKKTSARVLEELAYFAG
jgi:hypothetical protein